MTHVTYVEVALDTFWLCICFASDSTTASKYTILFTDQKQYESLKNDDTEGKNA
jgi:hypothetical protein